MTWLTSLPAATLVASGLALALLVAIAGRLAVKTGSGVLTDAIRLAENLVAEQYIFCGLIVVHSRVRAGTPVIAVRPNSVTPQAAPEPAAAELIALDVQLTDAARSARVTERVQQERIDEQRHEGGQGQDQVDIRRAAQGSPLKPATGDQTHANPAYGGKDGGVTP